MVNSLINTMKRRKYIISILTISLLLRILLLFRYNLIWWDSSVYIGMGKWIFSNGAIGLWEFFRPPFLPLILGSIYKVGLSPVLVGRIIEIMFSLGVIFLTYLIGKEINEKVGLISALVVSFTPVFLSYSIRILTGIPSTFFALISIYLLVKKPLTWKKVLLSSIFSGIAFLTRFPQGILLVSVLLAMFLSFFREKKKIFIKRGILFFFGFLITVSPYLLFNQVQHGSFLSPFIKGSEIAKSTLWIHQGKHLYFYFKELLLQSPFYLFSLLGGFYFIKEKLEFKPILLLLTLFLFFSYFQSYPNRQIRFTLVYLPYLCILSSYGFLQLLNKIKDKRFIENEKRSFIKIIVLLSVVIISGYLMGLGTSNSLVEESYSKPKVFEFYEYLNGIKNKTILSNTPIVAGVSDSKVEMIYVPVESAIKNYESKKKDSDLIVINRCQLPCPPEDKNCKEMRNRLFKKISKENKKVFETKYHTCLYQIFER